MIAVTLYQLLIVSKSDEAAGKMVELIEPSQLERRFVGGTSDYEFSPESYLADYAALDGDRNLAAANSAFLAEEWGVPSLHRGVCSFA